MPNFAAILEFDVITRRLAELALCERAKEKALALSPTLSEAECQSRLSETTGARVILESLGTPPLSPMKEIRKILQLCEAGAMLVPEQLTSVASFLNTCGRAKAYLKRAYEIDQSVASFGMSLHPLTDVYEEIDRCVRGDTVEDSASSELKNIRRKMDSARDAVKAKLESMLRGKKEWFSESFIVTRNGRYALPVKKEYKQQVAGTVVDISSSGNTVFIEPEQARKLADSLAVLHIEEENEIRRVLYTLSGIVDACRGELIINAECMEALDFNFAKAKLALEMKASVPVITTKRRVRIREGRHPLLRAEACVPLNFDLGDGISGVIITGPNTGGKTVALKTVGLLSMMAQSGLHVPAGEGSEFSMHDAILCDIGDGQSITENLSTFSSHMVNIIGILQQATHESLVLLDELGSGTDPAEGMGLAVAVLEALGRKGCLLVATSHYPEIKEFAGKTKGLTNARMAFDRESLEPLYRLEMGEAGESCAIYIAQRLGFPEGLLERARQAAYGGMITAGEAPDQMQMPTAAGSVRKMAAPDQPRRCDRFQVGDSVRVFPQKEIGIVYRRADEKGMVGVQVKRQKMLVNHKRVQLIVAAEELYPDDYDFSIVFDSVANRKARHQQDKRYTDAVVRYDAGETNGQ